MKTSRKTKPGGGFPAIIYTLQKALEVGPWRLWKKMRSRNACKTCALGMGGQQGGMVNEAGHFPEVCKKAVQAQAGDMAAPIGEQYFRSTPIPAVGRLGAGALERPRGLAFPPVAPPRRPRAPPASPGP